MESPTLAPMGLHFPQINSRKLFDCPSPRRLLVPSKGPSQAAARGIVFPVVGKVASLEGRFQPQLSPTQRASLRQARKRVLFLSFLFQHILNHPRMQLGGKI